MTADVNGYPHGGFPAERVGLHQDVLNEDWPYRDAQGQPTAWPYRRDMVLPRRAIDVQVRVVWAVDGEEVIDGQATRWTRTHVWVAWSEPRLPANGVWVRASDVRRRSPSSGGEQDA